MNNPHPLKYRLITLAAFAGVVVLLFILVLYRTQVVHGSEYRARSISSNATSQTVEASRGVITDCNGKVLVSNRLAYTLTFSSEGFDNDADLNAAIWRLIELCRDNSLSWQDSLPISQAAPFAYTESAERRQSGPLGSFLNSLKLEPPATGNELLTLLRAEFSIDDSYTSSQARLIAGIRYELFDRDSFVLASDVPVELISQIIDGHYLGVTTGTASARVYNTPYAAHILGSIGPIYKEEWNGDEWNGIPGYKDVEGYAMNDLVGKSGVESAFESYLHGVDGTRLITTDETGHITDELYTKQPQPGGTVALTLDLHLQEAAESALATTIESMIDKDSNERGGAAAVVEVGSGSVLALASYPTYSLETFNEDYEQLLADERLPMFNRAVDGTYAPGSTFKLCTAVAALENGIITPSSIIRDYGVYTYYPWPQPACWVWNTSRSTHGNQNVSQAITNSCNYFFFEVGRLMGIETIDDYARQFGLGRSTGIEIGDSSGALASPEYAASHNLEWSDGQTITAAIGQSYNLFTPLQLANYVATLVGGGEHYPAHLLKNVKSYDNNRLLYVYDAQPENTVEMSESTLNAVKKGMHDLTQGSLSSAFSKCVVSAGAKTGSAQVGTDIANGTFVAFAPYDDPQIAVAIVIEKGGSGAALASTAVEIINAYFSRDQIGTAIIGENTLIP